MKSSSKTMVVVAVTSVASVALLVILIVCGCFFWRKAQKRAAGTYCNLKPKSTLSLYDSKSQPTYKGQVLGCKIPCFSPPHSVTNEKNLTFKVWMHNKFKLRLCLVHIQMVMTIMRQTWNLSWLDLIPLKMQQEISLMNINLDRVVSAQFTRYFFLHSI